MKYFDKDKAIEEIQKEVHFLLSGSFVSFPKVIDIISNNIKSKPETKSAEKYKNAKGQYDCPIGTKIKIKGIKAIVNKKLEILTCRDCLLAECRIRFCEKFSCLSIERKDKTSVIFKEIK